MSTSLTPGGNLYDKQRQSLGQPLSKLEGLNGGGPESNRVQSQLHNANGPNAGAVDPSLGMGQHLARVGVGNNNMPSPNNSNNMGSPREPILKKK